MCNKTYSVITTTVRVPHLLESYIRDAIKFGRKIEQFIVVGDRKTPKETAVYCAQLEREYRMQCRYISVEEQEHYLQRWPHFASYLPWNSITRRNVGFIIAYESNADIIVTIDDDNFIHDSDYLGNHAQVGDKCRIETVSSQAGWWNVCEMLEDAQHQPFYHRGYPFSKRWKDDEKNKTINKKYGRIVVNAGLWLGEPDIDAVTRLCFPLSVTKPSRLFRKKIACDIGTWSPFDSQNTALLRDLIPAYFMLPYVGRYDDIWASYIVKHISDHMGDFITFGSPLVRQKRNPQSSFKNLDDERFGMEYTDIFLEGLRLCTLSASSYKESFSEIVQQFPNKIKECCNKYSKDVHIFDKVCEGLQLWSEIFKGL